MKAVSLFAGVGGFDLGFNLDGIIVGGFPCQDVSVAGKRAGLSDSNGNATRSGLFWEVVRLLEETKAQHFILENVPGLLSSNEGRDFGIVLNALVELGGGSETLLAPGSRIKLSPFTAGSRIKLGRKP